MKGTICRNKRSGVGYEHVWGATETVTLDYLIDYKGEKAIEESVYSADWNGSMQVVGSFNHNTGPHIYTK